MGWDTVVWMLVIVVLDLTRAKLMLTGVYKENVGYEITCVWDMENDILNSVRLFKNESDYFEYSPMKHSRRNSVTSINEDIDCMLTSQDRRQGKCVHLVKFINPSTAVENTYKCETSGEGPRFLLDSKEHTIYVPPTTPVIKQVPSNGSSPRQTLECTSSGIPSPEIVWTIDGRRIPSEFKNRRWNSITKLWQETAKINVETEAPVEVKCSTVIGTKRQVMSGSSTSVTINSSTRCDAVNTLLMTTVTVVFTLLR